MTTTASTSSNLLDKDRISVYVRRDGLIERQRFNTRVCRQLLPPVQSILLNTSTTIDESTATSDSNQACSSASSIDNHADDYIFAQKSISIIQQFHLFVLYHQKLFMH
ncbi:unnamed protein product [Rotaria sp. Silwood2]|nr:unnamed protein product [Rotaria sp. Silwood2]